jgi:hypothetical protein
MVIRDTFFPHKTCHKIMWESPDCRTSNQIDHIAISRKWRKLLLDVQNKRGADITSDHHLIIGEIRIKILSKKRKKDLPSTTRKFQVSRLKGPSMKSNNTELRNRFEILWVSNDHIVAQDIELQWGSITKTVLNTSEDVLGRKRKQRKDWVSIEA